MVGYKRFRLRPRKSLVMGKIIKVIRKERLTLESKLQSLPCSSVEWKDNMVKFLSVTPVFDMAIEKRSLLKKKAEAKRNLSGKRKMSVGGKR